MAPSTDESGGSDSERGSENGRSGESADRVRGKGKESGRAAAEEKVRLAERLEEIGKALTAELDRDRLAQAVIDAATELTGADFGAFVYNPTGEGDEPDRPYVHSGASAEALEDVLPPRKASIVRLTLEGRDVVRSDDVTEEERSGRTAPFPGTSPDDLSIRSYLAVPVASRGGRVTGGLLFGHPEPGVFGPREEELASGVAGWAAVAFDNARLYERERKARSRAEDAADRMRFLGEVAQILSSSLDYEATLEAMARLSVPRFADGCVVDVMEGDGTVGRVAVVHRDDAKEAEARTPGERFAPHRSSPQPVAEALRTGESQLLHDVVEEDSEGQTLDPEHRSLIERLDARSTIAVPLEARGHVLGALTFVRGESGRRFDEADLALARELADRAALSVDNARLYETARSAEERATNILESITDTFFALDREWRYIYLNPEARRLTGELGVEDPDALLGRVFWEMVPEIRGTRFEEEYRRAMESGEACHFQAYFEPWDRWYETHAYPSEEGLSVYLRDITERKRMEAERERLVGELEFERSRLETVFQESPAFIAVLRGPEHVFEMVNPPYQQLIGHKDALGKTVREVFPEVEGQGYFELLDRVYETGEAYVGSEDLIELQREPDGPLEEVYLDFVYQPLTEADGSVSGILAHGHEITAQVRVREELERQRRALEEAEQRASFLAEASRVLASSLDYDRTLQNVASLAVPGVADWCAVDVVAEDGTLRRVGVAHEDPEKVEAVRRLHERYPPDPGASRGVARAIRESEPDLIPEIRDSLLEEVAQDEEHLRMLSSLGLESALAVPLEVRGSTFGAITFVHGGSGRRYGEDDLDFAADLADRAALAVNNAVLYGDAEEARGEAEQRAAEEKALRRAAEAVGAGKTVEEVTSGIAESAVRATGAGGAVVERLTRDGVELETVAGAGAHTLPVGVRIPFQDSLAQAVIERNEPIALERLETTDHGVSDELRRACGDCSVVAVPLVHGGEALGGLFLLRGSDQPSFRSDEVERARTFGGLAAVAFRRARLLEREERRSEELQRVMESRSRLVRGFTHDIKNPVGAAESHARLLLEEVRGELTDDQRDSVERIVGSLESALALIDDVFELSRAEAGEIRIESAPVDLEDLVADVLREHRAEAEARGLDLSLVARDDLPSVETDGARVRQILGNLISNALKFTRSGKVDVELAIRSEGPRPGTWVAVAVRDTGPGVPEEEREVLFQEFRRSGSRDAPGTGLGLPISRRIARLLGGDITLESETGEGSVFTVWLPLRGEAADRSRRTG